MQILIRDFTYTDESDVVAILREIQAAELPFNPRIKPVAAIGPWYVALLKEIAATQDSAFLVAEMDGRGVGFAFVLLNEVEDGSHELLPYSHAHIIELGVLSAARGKGVGMALLRESEIRAKAKGHNEITLAVYVGNEPARKLYAKAGYDDFKLRMRKTIVPHST